MKELKSDVSDPNTSVENLINQLDHQYSLKNCILIHGITETQDGNTDDISLRTIDEHLELELTEKELDRTYRIGNPKSVNKRTRPIIAKFARYYTRRKVFVNKKRLKILEFQSPKDLPNTGWNLKKKKQKTSLDLTKFGRLTDEYFIMMR